MIKQIHIDQENNFSFWWQKNGFDEPFKDGIHFAMNNQEEEGILIVTDRGNSIRWYKTPKGCDTTEALEAAQSYYKEKTNPKHKRNADVSKMLEKEEELWQTFLNEIKKLTNV